jgi:hypothetical protein
MNDVDAWRRQMDAGRRPFLHQLVMSVLAPSTALCGSIRCGGAHGVYVDDRRIVSASLLTIDDEESTA